MNEKAFIEEVLRIAGNFPSCYSREVIEEIEANGMKGIDDAAAFDAGRLVMLCEDRLAEMEGEKK